MTSQLLRKKLLFCLLILASAVSVVVGIVVGGKVGGTVVLGYSVGSGVVVLVVGTCW